MALIASNSLKLIAIKLIKPKPDNEHVLSAVARLCQRIFLLERDLLYQPSSCLHRCIESDGEHVDRLELAVLLQQAAAALKECQ